MDDVPQSRAAEIFSALSREDVEHALRDLDQNMSHPFGPSTTYDLVHNGRRYPSKAVIGLAAKHCTGVDLHPNDFEGGEETPAFHTLRRLGFEIVPKHTSPDTSVKFDHSDCEVFERYPNSVAWA